MCVVFRHSETGAKQKPLKDVVFELGEEMVSIEITALLPKVPIEERITIISECLSNNTSLKERTLLSVEEIPDLLRCCLTAT